jgi:hypothetical protein
VGLRTNQLIILTFVEWADRPQNEREIIRRWITTPRFHFSIILLVDIDADCVAKCGESSQGIPLANACILTLVAESERNAKVKLPLWGQS